MKNVKLANQKMNINQCRAFKLLIVAFICIFCDVYPQQNLSQKQLIKMYAVSNSICSYKLRDTLEKIYFEPLGDTTAFLYDCKTLRLYEYFYKHKDLDKIYGLYLLLLPQHHMKQPYIFLWITDYKIVKLTKFNDEEYILLKSELDKAENMFSKKYKKKLKKLFKTVN